MLFGAFLPFHAMCISMAQQPYPTEEVTHHTQTNDKHQVIDGRDHWLANRFIDESDWNPTEADVVSAHYTPNTGATVTIRSPLIMGAEIDRLQGNGWEILGIHGDSPNDNGFRVKVQPTDSHADEITVSERYD